MLQSTIIEYTAANCPYSTGQSQLMDSVSTFTFTKALD